MGHDGEANRNIASSLLIDRGQEALSAWDAGTKRISVIHGGLFDPIPPAGRDSNEGACLAGSLRADVAFHECPRNSRGGRWLIKLSNNNLEGTSPITSASTAWAGDQIDVGIRRGVVDATPA